MLRPPEEEFRCEWWWCETARCEGSLGIFKTTVSTRGPVCLWLFADFVKQLPPPMILLCFTCLSPAGGTVTGTRLYLHDWRLHPNNWKNSLRFSFTLLSLVVAWVWYQNKVDLTCVFFKIVYVSQDKIPCKIDCSTSWGHSHLDLTCGWLLWQWKKKSKGCFFLWKRKGMPESSGGINEAKIW